MTFKERLEQLETETNKFIDLIRKIDDEIEELDYDKDGDKETTFIVKYEEQLQDLYNKKRQEKIKIMEMLKYYMKKIVES